MKHTREDLKIMQSWSLERKIQVTQTRTIEWYQHYNGQVYISFSGGKDSTVLLDLARRIYPDIEAVFVDTGLEYPEIRQFVKTKENVTWIKPDMRFDEVVKKYGYPVISKEVSMWVTRAKKNNAEAIRRFNGNSFDKSGKLSFYNMPKWKFLINAPFKISDQCCDVIKKKPLHKLKKKPITAMMAGESRRRLDSWVKTGCNAFDSKRPISNPMSFWTEQDILHYIKRFNISYCSVYGDIVPDTAFEEQIVFEGADVKLKTTGLNRTGCMFCMFGVHLEKEPNRFQRMKITHPKQYDYCINKLGLKEVLDFIKVKY